MTANDINDIKEIVGMICSAAIVIVFILAFCTDFFDRRGK